jgi:hypothetical protein
VDGSADLVRQLLACTVTGQQLAGPVADRGDVAHETAPSKIKGAGYSLLFSRLFNSADFASSICPPKIRN